MTKIRATAILTVTAILIPLLTYLYPLAHQIIRNYPSPYHYYPHEAIASEIDTAKLPPAQAVPILLFHGVVDGQDQENTTLPNFIADMEMLKREGYTTITLYDLDQFYQGHFTLPPKPIILTFDDGRKDSFYPTDDILKKLGFKATLFEVTIKPLNNDPFYLTWKELAVLKNTGRWDIQAHGRRSHERIPIDDKGTIGRYLSSRRYNPITGLETVQNFKQRVEQDYRDGIADLKKYLGIKTDYYAVPLNDYGNKAPSNYPDAATYNQELIKKYFRIALIESYIYEPSDNIKPSTFSSVYNYADTDPLKTTRLEVKNMSATDLNNFLEKGAPKLPNLYLDRKNLAQFQANTDVLWGNAHFDNKGLTLEPGDGEQTGKVMLGDVHWKDYTIKAQLARYSGRSVDLISYAPDHYNGLEFGFTDNGLFLRQTVNGIQNNLASPLVVGIKNMSYHTLVLKFKNGIGTAYYDWETVFTNIHPPYSHGAVGFKVWGDNGPSQAVIRSLEIEPTN